MSCKLSMYAWGTNLWHGIWWIHWLPECTYMHAMERRYQFNGWTHHNLEYPRWFLTIFFVKFRRLPYILSMQVWWTTLWYGIWWYGMHDATYVHANERRYLHNHLIYITISTFMSLCSSAIVLSVQTSNSCNRIKKWHS